METSKELMQMYPTKIKKRTKIVFKCLKKDNPIEFFLNCEELTEIMCSNLTEKEKIDFVSKHFQYYATRWYTTILENFTLGKTKEKRY